MDGVSIRQLVPDDYGRIIPLVNDWWGGRNMRHMLPRLFFVHFAGTSFVAERRGQLAGFLVGFLSQCYPEEAYIHFVGVHPGHRKNGIAKTLYAHFFAEVESLGRSRVRCVTSPVNKGSIAFHRAMGFEAEQSGHDFEGVPFAQDYDGPGEHRVLFSKPVSR